MLHLLVVIIAALEVLFAWWWIRISAQRHDKLYNTKSKLFKDFLLEILFWHCVPTIAALFVMFIAFFVFPNINKVVALEITPIVGITLGNFFLFFMTSKSENKELRRNNWYGWIFKGDTFTFVDGQPIDLRLRRTLLPKNDVYAHDGFSLRTIKEEIGGWNIKLVYGLIATNSISPYEYREVCEEFSQKLEAWIKNTLSDENLRSSSEFWQQLESFVAEEGRLIFSTDDKRTKLWGEAI